MHPQDPVNLERLLPAAVAVAMQSADFASFRAWLQQSLRGFAPKPSPIHQDAAFAQAFALSFGRSIWNALPLTASGDAPVPVVEPGRNDPCLCGSGQKYKRCCAQAPQMPAMAAAMIWPYVLAELPRAERIELAKGARIPSSALWAAAGQALEAGRAQDAIDILEPRLGVPEQFHDEAAAMLVDVLCDAYDARYSSMRRKIEFLEGTTQRAPRSPLRSEAWQRLATIYMDRGRHDDAWRAVQSAQRDDPDARALPLLEVHLLAVQRRVHEARERADFWIRRLERSGAGADPDDRRLEFLRRMRSDPLTALGEVALDAEGGAARPLAQWLAEHRSRAVPAYSLEPFELDDEDVEAAADGARTAGRKRYALHAPATLAAAERAWRKAFPLGKPFSIHEQPFEPDDVWAPEVEARWMRVLEAHPELFDSLDVLDDLAAAVGRHPQAGVHGLDHLLYEPLLARSEQILGAAIEHEPALTLPWIVSTNRAALRALARRYIWCMRCEDHTAATATAEKLIHLNPGDNHGLRFWLMNAYLRTGADETALALANAYPTDMMPDTRYGRVLALFRLGRLAQAEQALREARDALPKIARYLLAARIKRPKLEEDSVTVGGDDQAWIYRDRMREVWQATPGAMAWVGKMVRLK
jgi:tetratricopeptide (TPR) repeat protein